MYEHYVIATKRKLIDLGPPSMDVIVLQYYSSNIGKHKQKQ